MNLWTASFNLQSFDIRQLNVLGLGIKGDTEVDYFLKVRSLLEVLLTPGTHSSILGL